jgi:hypothetical protein
LPRDASDIAGHAGLIESRIPRSHPRRADTGRTDVSHRTRLIEAWVAHTRTGRADAWSPGTDVAGCPGRIDAWVAHSGIACGARLIDATVARLRDACKAQRCCKQQRSKTSHVSIHASFAPTLV